MKKAFFNWSGGKDSALALQKVLGQGQYEITELLTTLSSEFKRISMHGVREELLDEQADALGLPLRKVWLPEMPEMSAYDDAMNKAFTDIKSSGAVTTIFGDIFLEDLRRYREEKLQEVQIKPVFPLWKLNTQELVIQFIESGFKAITVCVDERVLDKSFAGRVIDRDFINDLPSSVDPCGENGEYHSYVFDGPIFSRSINFIRGELVRKTYQDPGSEREEAGFWYQDIVPLT